MTPQQLDTLGKHAIIIAVLMVAVVFLKITFYTKNTDK